jgi:hypothetical protein
MAMETASPEALAYRASLSRPFAEIVRGLVAIVGKKVTLYLAGIRVGRTLDAWLSGTVHERIH